MAPDERFDAGPFELARFGRFVVGRSRATRDQFDAVQAEMACDLPGITHEINALVAEIAKQVSSLPADRLLQRAWWEFAAVAGNSMGEFDDPLPLRMIDYVQSVIESVPPGCACAQDVDNGAWASLKDNVQKLFAQLNLNYQLAFTANRRLQDPDLDMELEVSDFGPN
ncbi:MAG: hypothetical protein ABSH56_03360 [Bryobacteraceae bacterium]